MRFGARRLFRDISFDVTRGEVLAITGSNGSGKSTLLRIICGLARPSVGEVLAHGLDDPSSLPQRRLSCGYLAPSANLYDGLTAKENLEFIAKLRGNSKLLEEIDSVLVSVDLAQRSQDLVSTFSSGMKQRLKLGSAILTKPTYLILDEPFSNLDEKGSTLFEAAINRHRDHGAVIIATNVADVANRADRQINIEDFPWPTESPFSNISRTRDNP